MYSHAQHNLNTGSQSNGRSIKLTGSSIDTISSAIIEFIDTNTSPNIPRPHFNNRNEIGIYLTVTSLQHATNMFWTETD
jgi:hypothetical protein